MVPLGGPAPQHLTNGTSLGPELTAISPPSPEAQGVVTGYVYAVDADEDRGPVDRAMGMACPHVHRIDITPPTVVHMGSGAPMPSPRRWMIPPRNSTCPGTLPTSGRTIRDTRTIPTGKPDDRNLLSPWESYKIYYGTYDPLDVPPDDNPTSETTRIHLYELHRDQGLHDLVAT